MFSLKLILYSVKDCVYVIDVGKMKERRFAPEKNMESLDTVWVSQVTIFVVVKLLYNSLLLSVCQ